MFGYVKAFKPELKVREFEQYRAIYCTVCKQLGKKYGHAVRMSLSYDFAFLAALGLTAKKVSHEYKKGHCVYNPLKKCTYTVNCDGTDEVYNIVCAAAVIMLYYKLTDDVRDKNFFNGLFSRFYRLIIKRKFKIAVKLYPNVNAIAEEMNIAQINSERSSNTDIDLSAEPTAAALGKICELFATDPVSERILYRIGYCVGKWVYLADALDDLKSDIKHNRFNPIKTAEIDSVVGTMNVCSIEAGNSFGLIDDGQLSAILNNIFYLGMKAEVKRILNKKDNDKHEKSI